MSFKPICVCVFAASILWTCAAGCAWMETKRMAARSNFQVVANHSLAMLRQTFKGIELQGRGSNFSNNVNIYNQVLRQSSENKVVFIQTILVHIAKLYEEGNFAGVEHNQDALDMFLQNLDRQTTELQKCIGAKTSKHTSKRMKRLLRNTRKHFQTLTRYLKTQGYNQDSWETVTAVALKHLERLHIIGASVK